MFNIIGLINMNKTIADDKMFNVYNFSIFMGLIRLFYEIKA